MGASLPFSRNTVRLLVDLIHQHTGHLYENGQWDRLVDKITPLMLERDSISLLDYYYLLKYSPEAEAEWRRVEKALAVNETYFWREFEQIRVAAEVLVPRLHRERPGKPVRIWHAACASGEEAYTMAIALTEAGSSQTGGVEIVATDFNQEALEQARAGIYRPRSFRSIPEPIREKYFTPHERESFRLDDAIRSRVFFTYLNLMDQAAIARMRGYDIIFCRNAFIYFSTPSIKKAAEAFYGALSSPGYLCIAASESLLRISTLFEFTELGGAYFYIKS